MSDQFISIIFEDRWRVLSLIKERDYDNPQASYCLRTHSLPSCRPQKAVIKPFKSGTVIKMFYLYLVQGYTSVKRTLTFHFTLPRAKNRECFITFSHLFS